jgi:hypothetical protein
LKNALRLDSGFGFSEIVRLASDLRSFQPEQLKPFTVPTSNAIVTGKKVVIPTKNAAALLSLFGRRPVAK